MVLLVVRLVKAGSEFTEILVPVSINFLPPYLGLKSKTHFISQAIKVCLSISCVVKYI